MNADDLAELAARALDMVGSQAQAAVSVTFERQGLTRFANSFVHQNMVDEHVQVTLQLSVKGRPAVATTLRTGDEGLQALVQTALETAALRPVDPDWAGLAPPAPLGAPADAHYDQSTADIGPAQRAQAVGAFVDAGEGLQAAGFCETSVTQCAFANTLGQKVYSRYTSAAFDGIQRLGRSDGVASTYSPRFGDLDAGALGAQAALRSRLGAHPVELPAGFYEVVLEPRCNAYVMDFFKLYAFNGKTYNEGRSYLRPGDTQFDTSLSIWDDATDGRHLGPAFDAEGTPKRLVPLVDGGEVQSVCHDRRTAAKAGTGASSTGHAVPGGETWGAMPANLFMGARPGPGPSPGPRDGEDLIRDVERGLLVCDFWYTRVLDPKTLVATGLTRNGVFLVENGQIGAAVTNLRFTQSYAAAYAPGNVLGVGADGRLAGGGLHLGVNHAPSLRLAAWHFTGNASQ